MEFGLNVLYPHLHRRQHMNFSGFRIWIFVGTATFRLFADPSPRADPSAHRTAPDTRVRQSKWHLQDGHWTETRLVPDTGRNAAGSVWSSRGRRVTADGKWSYSPLKRSTLCAGRYLIMQPEPRYTESLRRHLGSDWFKTDIIRILRGVTEVSQHAYWLSRKRSDQPRQRGNLDWSRSKPQAGGSSKQFVSQPNLLFSFTPFPSIISLLPPLSLFMPFPFLLLSLPFSLFLSFTSLPLYCYEPRQEMWKNAV